MILLDVSKRTGLKFATKGPISSYNWKKLTYMHISISRTNVYLDAGLKEWHFLANVQLYEIGESDNRTWSANA